MEKHKLIVMRHAKSDWTTNAGSDFDRPLAKRGIRDAPKMGRWLSEKGLVPDLIISSPALRAKQTALAVAEKLAIAEEKIVWERDIYEASLAELIEVVDDHSTLAGVQLLVGHNPGLDYLVEHLSSQQPQYDRKGKLMTTAAVAVLDFGAGPISSKNGSASLEILMRPKELKK